MKKLFTILALTIGFSMNAQLVPVTEGGKTGQRLLNSLPQNHGDIGNRALDLSYQTQTGDRGAIGNFSTAMGQNTTAGGFAVNEDDGTTYTTGLGLVLL